MITPAQQQITDRLRRLHDTELTVDQLKKWGACERSSHYEDKLPLKLSECIQVIRETPNCDIMNETRRFVDRVFREDFHHSLADYIWLLETLLEVVDPKGISADTIWPLVIDLDLSGFEDWLLMYDLILSGQWEYDERLTKRDSE